MNIHVSLVSSESGSFEWKDVPLVGLSNSFPMSRLKIKMTKTFLSNKAILHSSEKCLENKSLHCFPKEHLLIPVDMTFNKISKIIRGILGFRDEKLEHKLT